MKKIIFFILGIMILINICYTIILVCITKNSVQYYNEILEEKNYFLQWMWELGIDDISDLADELDNSSRMKFWQSIILQRQPRKIEIESLFQFHNKSLFDYNANQDSLRANLSHYEDYDSTIQFDYILPLDYKHCNFKRTELFLFKDSVLVDIVDGCNRLIDSVDVNTILYNVIGEAHPLFFRGETVLRDSVRRFENLTYYKKNDYSFYRKNGEFVFGVVFRDENGYYTRYYKLDNNMDYNDGVLQLMADSIRQSSLL